MISIVRDSLIEDMYQEHLDRMSPAERAQRTMEIFHTVREMLRFQVESKNADADEREVAIQVAEIMYMGDPTALALLARARADEKRQ